MEMYLQVVEETGCDPSIDDLPSVVADLISIEIFLAGLPKETGGNSRARPKWQRVTGKDVGRICGRDQASMSSR